MRKKSEKGKKKMMKKLMALVLALALICTAAISALAEEPLLGGWQVNAENPTEIPDEVRSALDKALDGFVGSTIEPVAYLASQMVSGMNYCLLCKVTMVVPDAVPSYALVYVYQDLAGNAQLVGIADLTFSLDPNAPAATLDTICAKPGTAE